MERKIKLAVVMAGALALCAGQGAMAEWHGSLGFGIASLALDGDIGFDTPLGPMGPFDVDLDNSDTSDLVKSGFGLAGSFVKGKWQFLYAAGQLTLEDDDGPLDAEWDRTAVNLFGVYTFAAPGKNRFGALFGVRYIEHDWTFKSMGFPDVDVTQDWTDGVVGLTHSLAFTDKLSWNNRIDTGFGDSEESLLISTGLGWRFAQHWALSFSLKQQTLEFENNSRGDADWYLYDVDETSVGVGIAWLF
jgi:hypothetical protein